MKKHLLLLSSILISVNAFAAPSHVKLNNFEVNNLYRDYRPADSNQSTYWSYYSGQGPTVVIYLHPTLIKNPQLKSDPLYINCNEHETIIAPGQTYSCSIMSYNQHGQLSYHVAEGYEKNGADVSIVEIDPAKQKNLYE